MYFRVIVRILDKIDRFITTLYYTRIMDCINKMWQIFDPRCIIFIGVQNFHEWITSSVLQNVRIFHSITDFIIIVLIIIVTVPLLKKQIIYSQFDALEFIEMKLRFNDKVFW